MQFFLYNNNNDDDDDNNNINNNTHNQFKKMNYLMALLIAVLRDG